MTLADRLSLLERKGYLPFAFAVTAFALGVQLALVTEALGATGYPPPGKGSLAWASGLLIAASLVLHVPWNKVKGALDEATELVQGSSIPRRSVHLAPYHDPQPRIVGGPPASRTNGHDEPPSDPEVVGEVRARVHSPLNTGPVVAPGEEVEFTIEAEPEALARELDVDIEVHGPSSSRSVKVPVNGTQATHAVTFDEPGEFTIAIVLDHPRSQPVAKQLRGRVGSYRKEVGRLFERLKEKAAAAGLDVGPGSTPREVCRILRGGTEMEASQLAELAVELEVALYGDEEVDRATYETVLAAIASTGLSDEDASAEVQP